MMDRKREGIMHTVSPTFQLCDCSASVYPFGL